MISDVNLSCLRLSSKVIPYLSRRAMENKSVLGQGTAAKERRRAATQIRNRLFGFRIGSS